MIPISAALMLMLSASVSVGSASQPTQRTDEVVFHAAHYAPKPGELFIGAFLRFTPPHDLRLFSLSCTVHLGG